MNVFCLLFTDETTDKGIKFCGKILVALNDILSIFLQVEKESMHLILSEFVMSRFFQDPLAVDLDKVAVGLFVVEKFSEKFFVRADFRV